MIVKSSELLKQVYKQMEIDPDKQGQDQYESCIIGAALHDMGMSMQQLKELNDYGFVKQLFEYEGMICGVVFEDDGAASELQSIQDLQDYDVEWGLIKKELSRA